MANLYLANHSTRPCSSRMRIHFELDDDAGTTKGGPEIVPILNFRSDSHVGIRPGSPAPISIAVAHLPLRASGSDE
jgi:hypothetical protein